MKREGRQHGMVRAYEMLSLPSNPRHRRRMISPPPTAGLFTRVPTKPTNHSKYTGKCGPVCKSMDKVKGAHRMHSALEGGAQGLKFYGFSASGVLNYLDRVDRDNDDDDQEADVSLFLEIEEADVDGDVLQASSCDSFPALGIEEVAADGVFDDGMGFCDVRVVWEQVDGDESWCLIDEI